MALGVGVATAVPAHADNVLNVSGQQWYMHQDNGYDVALNLQQDANGNLTGSATTRGLQAINTVTGKVTLSTIRLIIPWNANSEGVYDANLESNPNSWGCSFPHGTTYDDKTPPNARATAKWWSDGMNFEPCPNG
jgi:hypothetical protein